MTRIHIAGGPSGGKTTLTRRLANQASLPVQDLDAIGYEGGAGPKRPLAARLADVERIAAEPGWITEGIFLWWTDELLLRADLIIWLDLPWLLAAWRIIRRHALASLANTNRHRGIRNLVAFLRSARRYYSGPATLERLPTMTAR